MQWYSGIGALATKSFLSVKLESSRIVVTSGSTTWRTLRPVAVGMCRDGCGYRASVDGSQQLRYTVCPCYRHIRTACCLFDSFTFSNHIFTVGMKAKLSAEFIYTMRCLTLNSKCQGLPYTQWYTIDRLCIYCACAYECLAAPCRPSPVSRLFHAGCTSS